ncbi:hypothetical protein ACFPRL_13130 [Pseudoclavibacter helvolus]
MFRDQPSAEPASQLRPGPQLDESSSSLRSSVSPDPLRASTTRPSSYASMTRGSM